MYVVFFTISKLWLKLKYIYAYLFKHAEQTNGNKYMQNFILFHACKMTPFSCFREFAPPIEEIPLFRKNDYERGIRFDRNWQNYSFLTLNVQGPSYLGLTRSV